MDDTFLPVPKYNLTLTFDDGSQRAVLFGAAPVKIHACRVLMDGRDRVVMSPGLPEYDRIISRCQQGDLQTVQPTSTFQYSPVGILISLITYFLYLMLCSCCRLTQLCCDLLHDLYGRRGRGASVQGQIDRAQNRRSHFRSLPENFNASAGLANGDILVVRVDDIYLPHHISTHVRAMEGRLWSKPSFVLSNYTGRLEQEDATGRFHASLAFRREIFDRIGDWPLSKRGDFDKGRTPSPRKRRRTCAGMPIC
jgi:hypothetical protein